jgi:hypothetical protein
MTKFCVLAFAFLPVSAMAWSLQCGLGTTRCIKSQGTEIPSKQVIEILDRCREFTFNDIGRVSLRLSFDDVDKRSGGKGTPLVRAWFAFDNLFRSPLAFARKQNAEDTNYYEIKTSCQELERDFNDDSKWTK